MPTDRVARDALSSLLHRELVLDPARYRSIARISVGTAMVVAIAMTFQIPLPAYMAYLVFLVSQEDTASTLVTSVGGLLAATLAVALSILLYVFDASEPALRIPLLALSTFAGVFLARTSALGPVAFLASYVLVLSQTLADDNPATDPLTHGLLWLWVVVAVPVGVTVLLNLLFGESPVALSRRRASHLFHRLACFVESPAAEDPRKLRDELLAISELKNKAFLWDKRLQAYAQEDNHLVALLLEILSIARTLPDDAPHDTRVSLAASIREAGRQFLRRRSPHHTRPSQVAAPRGMDFKHPSCAALQLAVQELQQAASGHHAEPPEPARRSARSFLVPDAFENRAHARFAIKVMLAVLASYATYTLLDWPGTRTAVTTCFFVSLTTFGESVHKFTLRATGAIIGGLLAGLSIVFLLPLFTDIGQLCLLIAAVSAFCAWISTSSEAISYAGMQTAFAFFLGILQGYGPASDLTVLRDRVVGILIGNIWVTVVFACLWPSSAFDQARSLRTGVLNKLGQLLVKQGSQPLSPAHLSVDQDLSHAALPTDRAAFEWRRKGSNLGETAYADFVERATSRMFTLVRLRGSSDPAVPANAVDQHLSAQLIALSKGETPGPPTVDPDPTEAPVLWQARHDLEEEVSHAPRPN